MTLLHEKLQEKNAVAISAITGMGGVGKTENYQIMHLNRF